MLYPAPHVYYNDINKLKLFIIGQNPGLEYKNSIKDENEYILKYKELWWKSRFGTYIRENIGNDIIKKYMFFTNLCKCSSPKNSALLKDEINNCSPYLLQQIKLIKPSLILTFSAVAKNALNEYKNIKLFENIKIINFYHPSYLRYGKNKHLKEKQFIELQKIKYLI
jgi:uracil-DNA glycosylase